MELIDDNTRKFILDHRNDDVRRLALAADKYSGVDVRLAVDQIQGWQTARRKLPSWAATDGIVYPPHLNMEQCSSETTATYKRMVAADDGNGPHGILVDLTGGFGVDFSFLSRAFRRAVYVERNESLCTIARHNFRMLGMDNAAVVNADSSDVAFIEGLPGIIEEQFHSADGKSSAEKGTEDTNDEVDSGVQNHIERLAKVPESATAKADNEVTVFLDPARRDSYGRKMVSIRDCEPDVLALLPALSRFTSTLILKLSPMLDWHEAVREINAVSCIMTADKADLEPEKDAHADGAGPTKDGNSLFTVSSVHIVAVRNECKELLIVARNSRQKALYGGCEHSVEPMMYCVDDGNAFSCSLKEAMDHSAVALATLPTGDGGTGTTYLYVPNSAVMKAGCFHALASYYSVDGVGPNSHLFVSGRMIDGFPGRVFRIIAVSSMNKRELKRSLAGVKHANIATRNFPMSVEVLRKRLKVTDGGDVYIFATTVADGSHVLIITKKAT